VNPEPKLTVIEPALAVTTSVVVAEWTSAPLVPFTVSEYEPVGVELPVETVIVEEPDPVTEAGEKEAVAPVGNPLTLKVVAALNPLKAFVTAW
jgi:hypothetical protein